MSKAKKTAAAPSLKLTEASLMTSEAEINKAIESIKRRGSALQADMHKAACSVLLHLGKHEDIRVLRRFLDALPDMTRTNAMRQWFEAFGPVSYKNGTAELNKDNPVRLGNAMEKPFWKFKANEGAPYVPLADTYFASIVSKLEKDAKETGRNHTELMIALRAAEETYKPETQPTH
jgi:hypothetical protein